MWPNVPEALNSLSAAALRQLSADIRAHALSLYAAGGVTDEVRQDIAAHLAQRTAIEAEAQRQDDDAATAAALAAEAEVTPEVEPTVEVVPAAEVEVVAAAPAPVVTVPTTVGVQSEIDLSAARSTLGQVRAVAGVPGMQAGDSFSSWAELADTIHQRSKGITAGSSEKFEVARIYGNYPQERILRDDRSSLSFNLSRFEPDELTAALCAPATPYYGLACDNTMRRPVFGSLPQFQAPRGAVSIPSSPTLQDVLGGTPKGYGQWTFADDDNPAATKQCATVACNDFDEFRMYAVWRCLTVQNMMMMTYPELVEAYLNRLGAAWARLAETLLLDAMATGTVHLNALSLGYGATTTLTTTLLEYLALYQETQRWDITGGMEVWAHRYIQTGIKMDLMRRRRTSGDVPRVPTDAEVDGIFANAGFNMHWFIDTPSWAVPVSSVGTGNLNRLPTSAQFLIAPPGKFALIDRGELAIGVNGNNLYRDNSSNARNQFTLFFENFEGIVNTTSCPAHIIDIPLCWNGVQVDDQLVNCAGLNMPGFQS